MGYFHRFLLTTPASLKLPFPKFDHWYLVYDGLWFGKLFCLMVYRVYRSPFIIHASITKKEWGHHIAVDLRLIAAKGYRFVGVITDGGTGVVKAKEEVFPHTPHQICLVHTHRQATSALGQHPQDYRVKQLKKLADHLFLIESKEALSWWQNELKTWVIRNHSFLMEYRTDDTGRWWYVHKGARKAVRILSRAPATSFTFLSSPLMPRDTNGIEGMFTNVSMKWLIHRGLKRNRWPNFLLWFIYFRNQKLLADSKQTRV